MVIIKNKKILKKYTSFTILLLYISDILISQLTNKNSDEIIFYMVLKKAFF